MHGLGPQGPNYQNSLLGPWAPGSVPEEPGTPGTKLLGLVIERPRGAWEEPEDAQEGPQVPWELLGPCLGRNFGVNESCERIDPRQQNT